MIQEAPLQVYYSALVFAPKMSIVRSLYNDRISKWAHKVPTVENKWSPLEQMLTGHSSGITSVAFSPGGKKVVSGSKDSTVRVWDIAGQADQTLTGHSDSVMSVAFSPDGKKVVSGSDDSTVRVWDIATGQADQTLTGHSGRVNSMVFSLDGKAVLPSYTLSKSKHWVYWNGSRILYLSHDIRLGRTWSSPCGNVLVIGHRRGRVTIISYVPEN
jgi:WD40 repeat protein